MDHRQFDSLVQAFAVRRSRRATLKGGALAVAGAAVGARDTSAQGTPAAEGLTENAATMFVQTAVGGTFLPNTMASPVSGFHGDYLLTLSGHSGQTIGFTDRPQRDFGQIGTTTFIEQLGFSPENPPNAAIVTSMPDGTEDILVVELFNPVYDGDADLLIYEANILGEYTGEGLAPAASRQDDDTLATEFAHVSLFIDDCPDIATCYRKNEFLLCPHTAENAVGDFPGGRKGQCWSWSDLQCMPCDGTSLRGLTEACSMAYPQCSEQQGDAGVATCCAG